jgi:hypothetical protein
VAPRRIKRAGGAFGYAKLAPKKLAAAPARLILGKH